MTLKYFLEKIKDIKIKDVVSICPMLISLLLLPFYKKRFRNVWLISETPNEARDNAYFFYRYMTQQQPQQLCIYAIRKNSADYRKVAKLGKTVQYGSILHWCYYFSVKYNISSQKGDGKPNAAVCSFLELNDIYNAHNVFLQHGIIINDTRWLYSDRARFQFFMCSTIPEYDFICKKFGYPKGVVSLTGLARMDNLHSFNVKKNRILIMPTWRTWFNLKSHQDSSLICNFENSDYLKKWTIFLDSDELNNLIDKYNLEIIFYPHRNMQKYLDQFRLKNKSITIANWKNYDIQELLKTAALLITDYSSVFFDMIYMKKPVIFYQFDIETFRKFQYEEGYFDYFNNPFGNAYTNYNEMLVELEAIIKNAFRISKKYEEAHKEYFKFWDTNNSKRIFDTIK